jgi:hypothetical protein
VKIHTPQQREDHPLNIDRTDHSAVVAELAITVILASCAVVYAATGHVGTAIFLSCVALVPIAMAAYFANRARR